MNDFLDNLAADQYQKMHKKEEIAELKRQILELKAEISTLKAFKNGIW
jgi:hypothetical protein